MSPQVPTRDPSSGGGPADCDDCFPSGGGSLQFLGIDGGGDRAWLTAPYANYLYNSSGAQSGNRFNDWADLMDAVALIEGPKTITFEQDELIPAGAYDLNNIQFRGNFQPLGAGGLFVTLDEGVTFTDITQFSLSGGVGLVNSGSAPNMVIGAGEFVILAVQGNSGIASTNAPMFLVDAGGAFVVGVQDGGVVADMGQPVIEVDPAANFAAVSLNGVASEIQDNTLSGNGLFVRLIQGVAINSASGLVQPAFTGMVIDQLFTDAVNLGYDPSGSGGVLFSTNVRDALNELAGLV